MKTDTILLFKPEVQIKPLVSSVTVKKKKRGWKFLTGFFSCFLPTFISVIYFAFIASDQYVTEVRFAVRSHESQQLDPLGMLTGLPSSSALGADSYIVVNFLQSREVVEAVNKSVPLRLVFGAPSIDWWARFDANKPIEYLTRYWKDQIQAQYEPSSALIRVQIKAFSAKDSLMIGEALLRESENLVNRLSQKARLDAVKAANEEVQRSELRLRLVRIAMKNLRERESVADPLRHAGLKQDMAVKMQGELAALMAEIFLAKRFMKEDSPALLILRARQKAIEEQLSQMNDALAGQQTGSTTTLLAAFEELETERQFAEKAYGHALVSLERSRVEADKMQRYLAVFVRPALAETPLYPKRLDMMLVIFIASLMLWGVIVFVVQAVKDH